MVHWFFAEFGVTLPKLRLEQFHKPRKLFFRCNFPNPEHVFPEISRSEGLVQILAKRPQQLVVLEVIADALKFPIRRHHWPYREPLLLHKRSSLLSGHWRRYFQISLLRKRTANIGDGVALIKTTSFPICDPPKRRASIHYVIHPRGVLQSIFYQIIPGRFIFPRFVVQIPRKLRAWH